MANYDVNALAKALVTKGGYNQTDAMNAAQNKGGRADDLAREFLGIGSSPSPTTATNTTPSGGLPSGIPSMADVLSKQAGQEQNLITQFQNTVSGQEPLTAIYTRLQNEQGVPQLQGQIANYEKDISTQQNLLDTLESSVNERTKGTLTTEAQRQRQLASESAPLVANLGSLGKGLAPLASDLATREGNVTTGLSTSEAEQQRQLTPITTAISAFSDQAAREITGYSADQKSALDVYTQQVANGQELTMEQQKEAAALIQQEKDFNNQKGLITAKMNADITYNKSVATSGGNTTASDLGSPTGTASDWTVSGVSGSQPTPTPSQGLNIPWNMVNLSGIKPLNSNVVGF